LDVSRALLLLVDARFVFVPCLLPSAIFFSFE
jgi:hypothetical protein